MKYRSHEPHRRARYISLGVFFIICVSVFAVRLIYYQLAVRDTYASAVVADANVRTVTVQAQRGSICDRNGTVLVRNTYTYDLQIEYGALPESRADAYASYLGVLDLLESTGTPRASQLSPFEGSYPDYTYSEAALDTDSVMHKKLLRVLDRYYVTTKKYASAALAFENVSASQLAGYIAQNYDIVTVKKDGTVKTDYKTSDIDRLVALRYDMAASDFGPVLPYVLAHNVDERLISAVSERHLAGITFSAKATRVSNYLKADGNRYASHILGTVGSITAETGDYYTELGYRLDATVGRSGCELAFEEYLHGTNGTLAIVEDDRGCVIDTYWVKEPIPGRDVWLTIDINVQMAAENSLTEKISENGGVGGAVAATAPDSGEILALASAPDNELNRAVSAYEPGSTFKVGMALAALNEGIIKSTDRIYTPGKYLGLECSHYAGDGVSCCGNINVAEALERSCNYFFCYIGGELGMEKIQQYASVFGFGQNTGIEIGLNASTGEATGSICQDSKLDYMAAIGQLNLCTPLQISQYISMIANGGTRYSAHILKYVRAYDTGEIILEKTPQAAASLESLGISEKDISTVQHGMYLVVNGENASSYVAEAFRDASYTSAGKTGTAERNGQRDNALYVGYAPYNNPKIVVTCFIEQGNTGGLASGVVRDVTDAYSEHVSALADNAG